MIFFQERYVRFISWKIPSHLITILGGDMFRCDLLMVGHQEVVLVSKCDFFIVLIMF